MVFLNIISSSLWSVSIISSLPRSPVPLSQFVGSGIWHCLIAAIAFTLEHLIPLFLAALICHLLFVFPEPFWFFSQKFSKRRRYLWKVFMNLAVYVTMPRNLSSYCTSFGVSISKMELNFNWIDVNAFFTENVSQIIYGLLSSFTLSSFSCKPTWRNISFTFRSMWCIYSIVLTKI